MPSPTGIQGLNDAYVLVVRTMDALKIAKVGEDGIIQLRITVYLKNKLYRQ